MATPDCNCWQAQTGIVCKHLRQRKPARRKEALGPCQACEKHEALRRSGLCGPCDKARREHAEMVRRRLQVVADLEGMGLYEEANQIRAELGEREWRCKACGFSLPKGRVVCDARDCRSQVRRK